MLQFLSRQIPGDDAGAEEDRDRRKSSRSYFCGLDGLQFIVPHP